MSFSSGELSHLIIETSNNAKKLIDVKTNQLSNSVEISIKMNEKRLSTDVLERTIYLLNEFQNNLLQQKAKNKSEYLLKTSLIKKKDLFEGRDLNSTMDARSIYASAMSTVFDLDFKRIQKDVFFGDKLQNLSDKLFKA